MPIFALLVFLLALASPVAADTNNMPEGYDSMVEAAREMFIDQPDRDRVQKIIDDFRAERNGRLPQDYEVRQELGEPGFNWASDRGAALNKIIYELLGQ